MGRASEEGAWTADEFLEWVQHQDEKWELVRGFPQLKFMAGGKRRHHEAAGNAYFALRQRLRPPCRAYTSDMAVRTTEDQVRFPDTVVDSGNHDPEAREASEPVLIVEVLSSSTRMFDLTEKLDEYRGIPSVIYVLFIDAGVCGIALHQREEDGAWRESFFENLDSVVELPRLSVELSLQELYENVPLPPQLTIVRK